MSNEQHVDYCVFARDLNQEVAFRSVEFEKDVKRLHQWHHEAHVIPFWQQNFSFSDYQAHLKKLLADRHHTLYIGYLDGVPMSYWEAYWVQDDIVGKYYEPDAFDQGVHLLIGPSESIGKGYALPLLREMIAFQFQSSQTKRVVAEPDIRNEKMIHVFEKCGFKRIKEIELPDKQALLMFCERERFFERWSDSEAFEHC
ncbi:GNAT family N-acetyltransferase [Bacillus tianshenii]|nr:GNAT family N-acetyltransferase [Bacillus tianshenii]